MVLPSFRPSGGVRGDTGAVWPDRTLTSTSIALLRLMRPANVVTAHADILAGYAAAGATNGVHLVLLLAATTGLYGGGVVFTTSSTRSWTRWSAQKDRFQAGQFRENLPARSAEFCSALVFCSRGHVLRSAVLLLSRLEHRLSFTTSLVNIIRCLVQ